MLREHITEKRRMPTRAEFGGGSRVSLPRQLNSERHAFLDTVLKTGHGIIATKHSRKMQLLFGPMSDFYVITLVSSGYQ